MPYDSFGFEDLEVPASKLFDFDTATPDERLIELARLLENEQEWRNSKMEWDFDVTYVTDEEVLNDCATAGCALGLARTMWPQWMLLFRDAEHLNGDFVAAKAVFDLSESDTDYLFTSIGYHLPNYADPGPKDVAAAIREFVCKRNAPPQDA